MQVCPRRNPQSHGRISVTTYACQNCNFVTQDRDQLAPIRDIHQRVEPGERMPAGECPECGALVHLED